MSENITGVAMSECTQCYKDEPPADNVGRVREMVDKSVISKKLERLEQIINDEVVESHKYLEGNVWQLFESPFRVDLGNKSVHEDAQLAERVGLPVEEITHYREVNGIPVALHRARANAWELMHVAERFISSYMIKDDELRGEKSRTCKLSAELDETKAELDNLRKKLMDTEEKLKVCRECNAFLSSERDCYQRQFFDADSKLSYWLLFGLPVAAGLGAGIVAILKHFFG